MTTSSYLEIRQNPNYLTIILSNEAQRNCLSPKMMKETCNILNTKINENCRFVLLLAKGEHFCAGADLDWMKQQKQNSLIENYKDSSQLQIFFKSLYSLNVPLISFVHGGSFGGGVGVVAACDYVVADPKATFCLSEVKLGLIPAVISPYVISKIGLSWFQAYSMSAKTFNANDAKAIGLVHEIASESFSTLSLDEKIKSLAKHFLTLSPMALKFNKKLIRNYSDPIVNNTSLEFFSRSLITKLRASEEGQDGMTSILEKRKPSWLIEEK